MNNSYTYAALERDIHELCRRHPEIPLYTIGKSREGRHLYTLKLGNGGKRIFFNGAHHGTEWLTSAMLMKFANELADGNHDASVPPEAYSLYLMPMVNPDGVEIAAGGQFWQANAAGVDLNHNYDALWHLSKESERENGIFGPGPTRFSGFFPESEPESRATATFTRQNSFDIVLAFHSQGEVFYRDFCGFIPEKAHDYTKRFEESSPYKADTAVGMASYGGYKDWFIKTYKRPGFTIEIGRGQNPLPMSELSVVYGRTLPLMLEALK